MKQKFHPLLFLFFVIPFFFSCKKEPLKSLEAGENLIYITSRDASSNLNNYLTFRIVDSVLIQDGGNRFYSSTSNDRAFTNAVRQQMAKRGFVNATGAMPVDLGLKISLIVNTSRGVVSVPGIWGGWDPFLWGGGFGNDIGWGVGPGWGWGAGPGWGGGLATYETREEIMNIDIFDVKNAASANRLTVLWNGLVRGNGVYDGRQAEIQIGQLFEQSPYLTR